MNLSLKNNVDVNYTAECLDGALILDYDNPVIVDKSEILENNAILNDVKGKKINDVN